MRYLNKDEERRLNKVLQQFSDPNSSEKINVRFGRTIAYRGVPGQTPEIDRITPKQLANLEKAANGFKESTGTIAISKTQTYQVQNGQQLVTNTLQPTNQFREANQIQASLVEIVKQNEKQEREIAQLRELMLEQSRLLQKVNAPVGKPLGNWFNQFKEKISVRVRDLSFDVREKVEAVRVATKQQVQSAASKTVTGIIQATGDRQVDGSVLLQANGQRFQAGPKFEVDSNKLLSQQQVSTSHEQPKATSVETQQSKRSSDEQQQQVQQKQRELENPITKKEVSLERLSDKQRERLFLIYAKEQQQAELASLNQADRVEFERLVSSKEQEYLIKLRARELREQFEKQQSNKSSINGKSQTFKAASPTLTQEYVNFKKSKNSTEIKGTENNFVPTKLPNSPQGFQSWYSTGKASDDFQISFGVIPPRNITPTGAMWYSQTMANLKTAEAKKLIELEKNRLKEAGFSPQQIQEKENDIHTKAFDRVHEQWKHERAEALKAWQESKGQPQNRQVEVDIADLENWRKEAQKIGRSEYHLEKIDSLINSVKEKNDPASSMKIDERDFRVMQRDRHEFNSLPTEEQTHTSTRGVGVRSR